MLRWISWISVFFVHDFGKSLVGTAPQISGVFFEASQKVFLRFAPGFPLSKAPPPSFNNLGTAAFELGRVSLHVCRINSGCHLWTFLLPSSPDAVNDVE